MKKIKYQVPEVTIVTVATKRRICGVSDQQFIISDDGSIRPGFDEIEDL